MEQFCCSKGVSSMASIHRSLLLSITLLWALTGLLPLGCGGSGSGTSNDQQTVANRDRGNNPNGGDPDDAVNCSDPSIDPSSHDSSDKVTICHIPPGNPANAHTIRVGAPAVPAHLAHGDHLGACGPGEGPCPVYDGGQPDAGNPHDGGLGGGPDGGTSCLPQNASCGVGTAPCCSPLICFSNVCAPRLN